MAARRLLTTVFKTLSVSSVLPTKPTRYSLAASAGFPFLQYFSVEKALPKQSRNLTVDKLYEKFLQFATLSSNGVSYLTPNDFILCAMNTQFGREPSAPIARRELSAKEVQTYQRRVKHSVRLFRDLGDFGLISFPEYVLLMTLAFGPPGAIDIAFNIFDRNGDGALSISEFDEVIAGVNSQTPPSLCKQRGNLTVLDWLITDSKVVRKDQLKRYVLDTARTGLTNFRFIENLRTEIMECGFDYLSAGKDYIDSLDLVEMLARTTCKPRFGRILLERAKRLPTVKISFQSFLDFFMVVRCLPVLKSTLQLFTQGVKPVCREDFIRAVNISTDKKIQPELSNFLFDLFDLDGSGLLDTEELITSMYDALKRPRITTSGNKDVTNAFKECFKRHYLKWT